MWLATSHLFGYWLLTNPRKCIVRNIINVLYWTSVENFTYTSSFKFYSKRYKLLLFYYWQINTRWNAHNSQDRIDSSELVPCYDSPYEVAHENFIAFPVKVDINSSIKFSFFFIILIDGNNWIAQNRLDAPNAST